MFEQKFNDDQSDEEQSDEKIVLDKSAFKALASDTRVAILKELDKRRKTMTELSETLNLAVATVKEHVEQLSKSKLVVVKDEGRKWKYCELTEKGKAVLYPERKKIWVMLASVVFMVLLSFYMTYHDIGYISTGRMLTSDSIGLNVARVLTESGYSDEKVDDDSADSAVYTMDMTDHGEVGIMDAQRISVDDYEDDSEYAELENDSSIGAVSVDDVDAYDTEPNIYGTEADGYVADRVYVDEDGMLDAKSSRNIPYLRYLAYAMTSISIVVLLLFVTIFSKKRKL